MTLKHKEIYTTIIGYETEYLISNFGNCISKHESTKLKYKSRKLKILEHSVGYSRFNLVKNKEHRINYVHRLVYESFFGKLKPGYEVNHIDGNKKNNMLYNLEAVTRKQNQQHASIVLKRWFGPHSATKVTNKTLKLIKSIGYKKTLMELSIVTGLSETTVHKIRTNKYNSRVIK